MRIGLGIYIFYLHTCFSAIIDHNALFSIHILPHKVIKTIYFLSHGSSLAYKKCFLILLLYQVCARSCFRLCTPLISPTCKANTCPRYKWWHLLIHFVSLIFCNVQMVYFDFQIASALFGVISKESLCHFISFTVRTWPEPTQGVCWSKGCHFESYLWHFLLFHISKNFLLFLLKNII